MTDTPAYSVTASADLNGTGTNGVNYQAEPPDVEVTFPMKQFSLHCPC